MQSDPVVIIGSGMAGYAVAREVRKLDRQVRLTIVTKDRGDYYAKPGLSTAFAQKKSPSDLVTTTAREMAGQLDVTLLAQTEALALSPAARRVHTSGGEIGYGKLVLALGADPLVLPVRGTGAANILSVNDLADYAALREKLNGVRNVLVIGAGLIGCEFANDLLHAGVCPTVVDPNALPLASLIPASAGTMLKDRLAAAGVKWRLGQSVSSVDRCAAGYHVTLSGGDEMEAEVVLSAVGLRPRTQLAKAAGLEANRGILVDAFAQTSAPDIFALGDCAEYESGVASFVQPILVAARSLARTLTGSPTAIDFPPMPVTIKIPTYPVVVHKPPAAVAGEWHVEDTQDGMTFQFRDALGAVRGFVLTGEATSQRLAISKTLVA